MHPYSEEIIRHQAVNEEGKACEILERITYRRNEAQGSAELVELNRRYDLQTGECLTRLSETEFEDHNTGARVRLQR